MNKKARKRRTLRVLCIALAILLVLNAAELVYSNRSISVSRYSVCSKKISSPLRLVFLSDLHCREFGRDNSGLLEKIAQQEPDLIALVGDIFSSDADEKEIDAMCGFIRSVAEIAPVYFGIGNQEHAHPGFQKDGVLTRTGALLPTGSRRQARSFWRANIWTWQ